MSLNKKEQAPRSLKIVQTNLETGREHSNELCWRLLTLISDRHEQKRPSEVLDALLWGDTVETEKFAYRLRT